MGRKEGSRDLPNTLNLAVHFVRHPLPKMTSEKAKVVGPIMCNSDSPAIHLLSPPSMEAHEDRMLWREAVSDWAISVQACAYGGNNEAKGIVSCLALTLYRSLALEPKELVKLSVRKGDITLNPATRSGRTNQTQLEMVDKILEVVAKDYCGEDHSNGPSEHGSPSVCAETE